MRLLGGYLKPLEASRYLGIPVDEVYRMMEQGELPGLIIEGQWRVPLHQLERWLDEEVNPNELIKLSKHLPGVDERKIKRFFKEATQKDNRSSKRRTKTPKSKGQKRS
jgi:excisionase family DNA binding protein